MFFSRIDGVAKHHGFRVKMIRTLDQCLELLARESPSGLLVDLQVAGADLERCAAEVCETIPKVAYGSHVDADSLRRARQVGFGPVMPRSQFVERLPREWMTWFGPSQPKGQPNSPALS